MQLRRKGSTCWARPAASCPSVHWRSCYRCKHAVKRHSREARPLMDGGTSQLTRLCFSLYGTLQFTEPGEDFMGTYTALCSLLEALFTDSWSALRRGSGIYRYLVVDRELHRVPGTLQFVSTFLAPSSRPSPSLGRGIWSYRRSGVKASQPLWLVGQAMPGTWSYRTLWSQRLAPAAGGAGVPGTWSYRTLWSQRHSPCGWRGRGDGWQRTALSRPHLSLRAP